MNPAPESPIGSLEYELTDELAFQIAIALFDVQARNVKTDVIGRGFLHPALPLVMAFAMLLIAQTAALLLGGDSVLIWILFALAFLAELLLLFKFAVYFWPGFARWYLRLRSARMIRRLQPRTIRWRFFEDRLETKSAQSQRSLPWTELKSVDVLADFWQLQYNPKLLLVVPTAMLSEELQEFVRRKAREVDAPFGN
jgi:hypothetical protein